MIETATPRATPALDRLPASEGAARDLHPSFDQLPDLLDWLKTEGFDGVVEVEFPGHKLTLLGIDGVLVGAQLVRADGPPLLGPAALRAAQAAVPESQALHARVLSYPRDIVECLTAVLDPTPTEHQRVTTDTVRSVLFDQLALGQRGFVDLLVGDDWCRALLHKGKLIGVFLRGNRNLQSSLAALGQMAAAGNGTLVVWKAPNAAPAPLAWPSAETTAKVVQPNERDERIETNLLWLLTHVERERDRARRASDSEMRQLQALAAYTNALFTFVNQLSRTGSQALSGETVVESLHDEFPLLEELEWRGAAIDTQALGRRYRALPRDGAYRTEFYRKMTRALLAMTHYVGDLVIQEIAEPVVRLRCTSILTTWSASVEAGDTAEQ